jgi:RHS repeat-associated protein
MSERYTIFTTTYPTENSQYLRLNEARLVNSELFNHAEGQGVRPGYSQRLNGSPNEKTSIARSLSLMPGDTVKMEVYAKYLDPNTTHWTAALSSLITSIATGSGLGTSYIDGSGYSTASGNANPPWIGGTGNTSSDGAPLASMNYVFIGRDFDPLSVEKNFTPITTQAMEDGTNRPHQELTLTYIAKTAGLMYIYLANDSQTANPRDVFFDDFTVTQIKSPVIQAEDYYPFGATFNSYSRENSVPQKYFYNSKEYQEDLNLNLYNIHARQYDPWTLRTTTLDPHADRYHNLSSYSWCANNPVLNVDPTGKDVVFDITRNKKGEITGVNLRSTIIITGEGASEERAVDLNKASAGALQSRTLKNGVKVSFDIKYQYKKDFNANSLKAGDNLLNFVNKPSVENSEQGKRDVSHVNGGKLFSSNPALYTAGNTGEIYKDDWNNNQTIFHESLHFTGLSDRYSFAGTDIGFSDDIMGTNSKKIGYDHYQAFYNVANGMPSWYPPYQKSFVNSRAVDRDYSTGEVIPPSQQQQNEQEQ